MNIQETLSVTYIQEICAISERLNGDDIRIGDKFPSLDGNIVYYSKPNSTTITGKEFFIPVQVKGVLTDQIKGERSISYTIEMKHLNNYFSNGGVLYLVVLVTKNAEKKLYAKILLPIDIKQIVKGKEEQNSVTVHLESVDNPNRLVQLCDLFSQNKAKQGIVIYNDLHININNVTEYNVSVIPSGEGPSIYDILQSNNIYTYAVEGGIEKPILAKLTSMTEEKKYSYSFKGGKVINYDKKIIHTSGQKKVVIANLIECNNILNAHEPFVFQNGFELNFLKTYEGAFFAKEFLCESEQESKQDSKTKLINYYDEIINLGNILKKLKVPLDELTTLEVWKNRNNILSLKAIILDKAEIELIDEPEIVLTLFRIEKKEKLVLYIQKENKKYIGYDFLYEKLSVEIYGEVDNVYVKVNPWFVLEDNTLDRIYIEYNEMFESLKSIDSDDPLYENINNYVMLSIKKYDRKKDSHYLIIAEDLTRRLLLKFPSKNGYYINMMQIKRRHNNLDLEDRKFLTGIKQSDDNFELCCVCILLEQWLDYEMYYSQLDEDEKEEFKSWPIYNLYLNLVKNQVL